MNTIEIKQKIASLERELNSLLFEDDRKCEKLYNKIQQLKFKLELEKQRERK